MQTNYIEVYGSIIKEEHLVSLESNIIPGTMVLETLHPFRGYYSKDPTESVPQTIFLATEENYSAEEIYRASQNIKNYYKKDFDAVKAVVEIYNKKYTTIRIYDIKDYSEIVEIQKNFKSEGIKMNSRIGKVDDICLITLKKVFLIEDFGEGVYLNRGKSKMGYFTIEKQLTFAMFQSIAKNVKNNWKGPSFDAALATFFRRNGFEEIVRIFSNQIDLEVIRDLKKAFEVEISRYI